MLQDKYKLLLQQVAAHGRNMVVVGLLFTIQHIRAAGFCS